ncbi:MAG TPA: hypothetical protein VI391_04300, partial [Thermoanaerobaculia bacterium]
MADDTLTVKGSPVRSLQKFIEKELTLQQREELLRSIPADFAQRLRGPILPTETIPVHLLNQVTEVAARLKGEAVDRFAQRAGHSAAGDAIKGIYRFFVLVMTPASLLSKSSQMWRAVYSRGELRVANQSEHAA